MISLAAIGLASVILIGCGSGGNETGSGGPGGPELKILKITVGSEPEDVDAFVVPGVPDHHIIASLTEGLVAEDPVDLHPVPGVAEKWDISEDGKVYLHDANDYSLKTMCQKTGSNVIAFDFSSDASTLQLTTSADELLFYSARTGEPISSNASEPIAIMRDSPMAESIE